jgi:predicted kinase
MALVGGLPGTGRTTPAAALADATGWSVLRSDEVRRDLGRNAGSAAYRAGAYSDESVTVTYREMLERARTALALGEPVILDASWRHEAWRAIAQRVADETASDLVELACEAPPEVAAARIASRGAVGAGLSDARPATLAAMTADFDTTKGSTMPRAFTPSAVSSAVTLSTSSLAWSPSSSGYVPPLATVYSRTWKATTSPSDFFAMSAATGTALVEWSEPSTASNTF